MNKRPDIELTHGSLGEGQPNFTVFVSDIVTPDQVEQIAMFMKQGADEMRIRFLPLSAEEYQSQADGLDVKLESPLRCEACQNSGAVRTGVDSEGDPTIGPCPECNGQ